MRAMNKEEARAFVRANLKGKKKKEAPLLIIAEAVRLLVSDREFGSTTKLADSFSVKRPTMESFDKMNDQPAEVKKLIEEGKIGIDNNSKLASIVDVQRRIAVAYTIAGLRTRDAREIIAKCKKDCNLEPEECKKAVINAKPPKKSIKVLAIPLEPQEHSKFFKASEKAGLSPKEAGKQAIAEWVKAQEKSS